MDESNTDNTAPGHTTPIDTPVPAMATQTDAREDHKQIEAPDTQQTHNDNTSRRSQRIRNPPNRLTYNTLGDPS